MHAGRAPGQFDVLPRPGESVLHGRASRSAASLLSLSMSTSMNSLGSMRKLTPYGMPKTGQRISLPMDQALQNLSTSLSDANLSSAPGPETWLQSGASNAAFRPWTSPAQEPTTGGRKIASAKQGVRGTKKCSEEQWLEGMLAQQQSDLHRERIARHQLREAGMKDGHISRLYRLLYLHTSSLQDVLLWITDQCTAAQRGATLLKVWQCLVRVVEHLLANKASSQFSSVLQQSNETIAALEESNLLEATRADHLGKQLGMATGRVEALEAHVYNLQEALETSKQEGRAGMLEEQTRAQTVLATAEAMLRKGDEYSMQAYEQLHSERLHSDQQTTKLTVAEHAREQAEKKLARARAVCQEAEEARRQAEADHAKGTSALRRMESELASRAQELAAERDARSEVEKQLEDEKTGRSVLEQQHTELREAMQALEAEYQTAIGFRDRFKERLAQEKQRNARLLQSSDTLKTLLEGEKSTNRELRAGLEDAAKVKAELEESKAELARQELSADGLIAEIAGLQDQVTAAEKEKLRLKQELDGALMRLDEAGLLG